MNRCRYCRLQPSERVSIRNFFRFVSSQLWRLPFHSRAAFESGTTIRKVIKWHFFLCLFQLCPIFLSFPALVEWYLLVCQRAALVAQTMRHHCRQVACLVYPHTLDFILRSIYSNFFYGVNLMLWIVLVISKLLRTLFLLWESTALPRAKLLSTRLCLCC